MTQGDLKIEEILKEIDPQSSFQAITLQSTDIIKFFELLLEIDQEQVKKNIPKRTAYD